MAGINAFAGITSGLDSAARRNYEDAQVKKIQQEIALSSFIEQQTEEDRKKQDQAKARFADYMGGPGAAAGVTPPPSDVKLPQPMSPGQPSTPIAPPMAAAFGPQGGAPPAMQMPPSSIQLPAGGGAPSGPAMPSPGWSPSRAAPPALGGQPPSPGMPAGGAPGAVTPPPVPAAPQPPPTAYQSPQAMFQWGMKQGFKPEDVYDMVAAGMPIIDKQNRAVLDGMRIEIEVQNAARGAADAKRRELEAAAKGPGGTTVERESRRLQELEAAGKGQTTEAKALRGHIARMDRTGGAGGAGAGGGGYGQEFEKLSPRQQTAVDWYATMQIGGDSTWRTGLSRVKGGAELIKAVDEYVPVKAQELGLSAADVGTNKAKRVASQAALTQTTKDLATLKPYVNMLDQNADILKGLAKKITKTDSALANKPINALGKYVTGNPDVAEFLAQVEILKNEATRVISNPRLVGQMTDTARKEIESILNGEMSLAATERVIDRIKNDGERRLTTMETQQKSLESGIKGMMGPADKADAPAAKSGPPKKGDVEDGHRFKGGDPGDPKSWEKV